MSEEKRAAPMADRNQFPDIPVVSTHGGKFVEYNIFGNRFEVTPKYRPPVMLLGGGAYGIVCSMLNAETNEMVTMKKIGNAFDNYMDAQRTLREIKLLRHLNHENVISIRDVVPPPLRREFSDVYIATELMESDLHRVIRSNPNLTDEHYQFLLYQLLRGLKYIHSANVIHRDLKPSNLLLDSHCNLKICDFGLARPTAENEFMTQYVVTRWYRAPELLLNSADYTAAIDIWSVGCICMEVMNKKPLFPGRDPGHQLRLIIELLGKPTEADLGFVKSDDARRYIHQLPQFPRQNLAELYPHVHPLAIDLVNKMLTFDPSKRITAEEALAHPYLESVHCVADEPICTQPFSFDFGQALGEEQMKDMIYQEALALNPEYA